MRLGLLIMSLNLQKLPKVELHAHLNGCIPVSVLQQLATEKKVTLHIPFQESTTQVGGKEHHSMHNGHPRSLQDCFDLFAELPKVIDDLSSIRLVTRTALEQFAANHVVYLELRSTPKRLQRHNGSVATKQEYIATVLQEIKEFEQRERQRYDNDPSGFLPMVCRLILSLDRSQTIQEAEETVDLAISMNSPYIVGVDLGGNPLKQDFAAFRPVLQKARDHNLRVTIHCAEIPCDNSTAYIEAQSILEFRPDRLGHAVLLPLSLVKKLDDLQIPVETCPTSNTMTLELHRHHEYDLVRGLKMHENLKHWLKTDYPISVCTDDPGVFDTTNARELELVRAAFGVDDTVMAYIMKRSMQYAFCDNETKQKLQSSIQERVDVMFNERKSM